MKMIKEKLLNKFLKIQKYNKSKEQEEVDKKMKKKLQKIMQTGRNH
jgi:hypothetical protein